MKALLLVAALTLVGCGRDTRTPNMELLEDSYLSLRIVNNELGKLLNEWKNTFLSEAQLELDMRVEMECKPETPSCRQGVKSSITQKYSERQKTYNEAHKAQKKTGILIQLADSVCQTVKSDVCKAAKDDALKNRVDVERLWNEVSSW